jgi:hypothetical protein
MPAMRHLLVVVRTGSEAGVDEGGCSSTRARARCACRLSLTRPAASTPASPAIAAEEGSRCGGHDARIVEGMEMRTFGDKRDSFEVRADTCVRVRAGLGVS